ncbi:fructosamine kinase family protein [Mucilaginibacter arboris]|uniref:Phosphotransferase n=1 Tax=Mucilaginibacter arboris TaxID=2682090 RepID=A0A7K1STY6_9SPHI|nr:fructosamine kinase family protein [Mucilaginibacter arboris]MVN20775.1 phosphotransferase [Mucilaginibacter arboris]
MKNFTAAFKGELESILHQKSGGKSSIHEIIEVPGGSINEVYRLQTAAGFFILKLNNAQHYPQLFEREAAGLAAIRQTQTVAVPEVIAAGHLGYNSFLLMEYVETGSKTPAAMQKLGLQLAQMHQNTAPHFGFEKDNYMGSLPQSNQKHTTWKSFFIEERLKPMVKLAFDASFIDQKLVSDFEKLYEKLGELFEEEKPSLIHGDLWGGNYLISSEGKPYLIDPAVSFGFREFDLAMTHLFGGFNTDFYQAYQEAFPLQKGWQQRVDLWNLYPLLLHLNLFGTGYLGQVRSGLKNFI